MRSKHFHLSGLNGLRAIAAMGVLLSHTTMGLEHFGLNLLMGREPNGIPIGLQISKYAVTIFFSLSGFLITYLLLLEKERQSVNIRKFYVRRILRIWPLYYLYLGLIFLTYFIFHIGFPSVLPFYLFYAANVPLLLGNPLPSVEHYWSLGVEEQFYIFWPWIVKKTERNLLAITLALITLIMLIKLAGHIFFPSGIGEAVVNSFPFHCMMTGAAGAILYKQKHRLFLQLTDNKLAQFIAWTFIAAIIVNHYHISSFLDAEIIAAITVIIIIGQINKQHRLINLEARGFDFLGGISFGIYVYHPLIILLLAKLLKPLFLPPGVKYIVVYASVIGVTVFVAYFSYTYFENFFLRLKDRFAVVKNTSTAPMSVLGETPGLALNLDVGK